MSFSDRELKTLNRLLSQEIKEICAEMQLSGTLVDVADYYTNVVNLKLKVEAMLKHKSEQLV